MTTNVIFASRDDPLVSQLLIYAQELNSLYRTTRYQFSELDEAKRRLSELDDSKSNFVHLISHELRTPVAVVTGYMEILTEMLSGRLEGLEYGYLQIVSRQIQHLSALVQQLTDYSHLITEELPEQLPTVDVETDLATVLRSELEAIRATEVIPFNLEWRVQIPLRMPMANLEPTRFRLIARYLLSNAIKFNQPNGWVSVSLQSQEVRPENALANNNSLQKLVLEIGNSGAVIPPPMLNIIFDSFRQVENVTSRHQGGLGIGLTIVARAVDGLAGQLEVISDPNGTFFRVNLPYRLWENPAQLKQKLQEMQSLVMRYAQDLRQLYNAEREKREKLAIQNLRLNAILNLLLTMRTPADNLVLPLPLDPEIAFRTYLTELAQAKKWQTEFVVEKAIQDEIETAQITPLNLALTSLLFSFGQTILLGLDFPPNSKVIFKTVFSPEQLTFKVQCELPPAQPNIVELDGKPSEDDNGQAREQESDLRWVNLRKQTQSVGGTLTMEQHQNLFINLSLPL